MPWLAEIGFGKLESVCFGLREDVVVRGLGCEWIGFGRLECV